MTISLLFKSIITTKETYPQSFEVKFRREIKVQNYEDENGLRDIIFNSAHDFENLITSGQHLVSSTTECLGYTWISETKSTDRMDLARLGLERID